ncbi:MAG: alpha/beta hydrolase-fold protein [Verrucomicrobiota bacterium]|nr:alpha/beta hydrolase-fold protein [Verrucomicrobiota bacterium]
MRLLSLPLLYCTFSITTLFAATANNTMRSSTTIDPSTPFEVELVTVPKHPPEGIIHWQESGKPDSGTEPLFTVSDEDIEARGWFATGDDGLGFHIVVRDPVQNNEFNERNLWRGDCVYLSFDALADSTDFSAPTDRWQNDDGILLLGLGTAGAEGQLTMSGDWRLRGKTLAPEQLAITRDESKGATIYTGTIPWEWLHSGPGISSQIGLAATIAHKNKSGRDLSWGAMQADNGRPRALHYFTLAAPVDDFISIAPVVTDLYNADDNAVVRMAFSNGKSAVVTLSLGDKKQEKRLQMDVQSTQLEVHRLYWKVPAKLVTPSDYRLDIKVKVDSMESAGTIPLVNDEVVMARFTARVNSLLEKSTSPIVTGHLRSTLAVVGDAYRRLEWERGEHPEQVQAFISAAERILEKLPREQVDFADAVSRGLPWVVAFVSEADATLQYASLQLPYNWDPLKKYPLVVYLHGAGTDNPIEGLTTAFENAHQDTLFRNEKIDPVNIPPIHQAFVLAPWGRGNSGYAHAAESDVLQSIALIKQHHKVDADRVYLTGFSMGCHGAFAIGSRHPDQFAGLLLASGFGSWSDTGLKPLWKNLSNTPLVAWIGSLDQMAEDARRFSTEVTAAGLDLDFTLLPNLPHTYPYKHFNDGVAKLLTHQRKVPTEFEFVSDNPKYQGCWGVRMATSKRFANQPIPHFHCEVKGGTVTITSENTEGLQFDPLPLGLNTVKELVVIWNGTECFRGAPQLVSLGKGARVSH